jgi:RNA polymerase sigma-70 factor, ECF subfamily
MADAKSRVTQLIEDWRNGDAGACDQLIALLYTELRVLAGSYMRAERKGHTLRPTALVHELYVKLAGSGPLDLKDRGHFLAIAARQMRRLLVDHARQAATHKRGAIRVDLHLDEMTGLGAGCNAGHLSEALDKLEQVDPRAARIIELRFFAGLSEEEAANALEISRSTARRDWDYARAWLLAELTGSK